MKNLIIAQVLESDRNIYITIEDGALVSVNYSQGLGDIDLHFLQTHDENLTNAVVQELIRLGDELYSPQYFFPSPYWDQQVNAIDNAIWMIIDEENKQSELIETIEKLEKQLVELKNKLN
jgi:hypothetical protein